MDLFDEEGLRTRSTTKRTLNAIVTKRPVVSPIKNEVNSHGHGDGGIPAEDEFPLSPLARLFHEPQFNCYIIAMLGSKKRIDPEVVKRGLVNTLLKHPRFSSVQVLADMMEKNNTDAKWGNWLGYVLLPFTIALRDNPLDYVREAKATIDRKKHSWEALYTFYSAKLILKTFGIKAASSEFHNILTRTTMSFSNVVGPREEIGFHSHSLAYLAPSFYGFPQGLTINFQSYMDKMTIVLAVDENLVPNPHQLLDDLEESLKLIKDAVVKESMMMRNRFMAKG